jgi:hypothetical protein
MLRHLADIFEITLDAAFFLLILLVFAGERSGGRLDDQCNRCEPA